MKTFLISVFFVSATFRLESTSAFFAPARRVHFVRIGTELGRSSVIDDAASSSRLGSARGIREKLQLMTQPLWNLLHRTLHRTSVPSSLQLEPPTPSVESSSYKLPRLPFLRLANAVIGVSKRKARYDPAVWGCHDPYHLLLKVMPMAGRSGAALMMLVPEKYAPMCLLVYLVFRVQDTWADVATGQEARIRGLGQLPKRLRLLAQGKDPSLVEDFAATVEKTEWSFTHEKHILYADIVKNVHRFDAVFLALPKHHQEMIIQYAESMCQAYAKLELESEDLACKKLRRQTAEAANDIATVAIFRAIGEVELANDLEREPASEVKRSFQAFSDFAYMGNLMTSMEEDILEGVCLDEDLRPLVNDGSLDENTISRVRSKWFREGLEHGVHSGLFQLHPNLSRWWIMRVLFLGFMKFTAETYRRLSPTVGGPTHETRKSAWRILGSTLLDNVSWKAYQKSVKRELHAVEEMHASSRSELAPPLYGQEQSLKELIL